MTALPPDLPPQTFKLPLGYRVTMKWENGGYEMEWHPAVPTDIRSLRHRRKLFDAYQAARAEYMQAVATVMGAAVAVVDTHDIHGRPNLSATAIPPAKVQ